MSSDKILSRIDGGTGHLIFNNPAKRNAVSLEMWQAVADAIDDFEANPDIRVLVVSGAGGKAFASGADISKFESERASADAVARYDKAGAAAQKKIQEFPRPVIAKIEGYCVGGGVGLAISCDIRICGDTSKFAVPAAKLGLGYRASGVRRLVDLVGPSFAKEIFYTARMFDSGEALAMGLVNRVVPVAGLEDYVADYAAAITANAPLTIAALKATVEELVKDPADRDMARSETMVKACFDSQDYIEGRRAFMEKRKPEFTGS
jgi:enoyl-CoA hydratase/carnithine racemase